MNAKQAARAAKDYIIDVFGADEKADLVGVEEVQFDYSSEVWEITIGFIRPWQRETSIFLTPENRSYKVVRINDSDGQITSVTHRVLTAPDSA